MQVKLQSQEGENQYSLVALSKRARTRIQLTQNGNRRLAQPLRHPRNRQ